MGGESAAVMLALIPANFSTLEVSMPTIAACGQELHISALHSIRGKDRSSVNKALPVA